MNQFYNSNFYEQWQSVWLYYFFKPKAVYINIACCDKPQLNFSCSFRRMFRPTGIYFPRDESIHMISSDFFACKPEECLLVSANYWDIIGAGWNGIKTFWVNRMGSPKDPLGYEPNFEGKSLEELQQIL